MGCWNWTILHTLVSILSRVCIYDTVYVTGTSRESKDSQWDKVWSKVALRAVGDRENKDRRCLWLAYISRANPISEDYRVREAPTSVRVGIKTFETLGQGSKIDYSSIGLRLVASTPLPSLLVLRFLPLSMYTFQSLHSYSQSFSFAFSFILFLYPRFPALVSNSVHLSISLVCLSLSLSLSLF